MSDSPSPLISAHQVTKVYHRGRPDEVRAVDGVSMSVARGEALVLRGPSGSGKTSLLSLVACMSRPTSGRVVVDGRDVARVGEERLADIRRRRFGFIFQQFHLIPELSVVDNVLLPLFPLPVGWSDMRRRADSVLAALDLTGKGHRKVRTLSGGEQQRAAIGRALINDPEIVVADEPTAHLDRSLARDLLRILEELRRQGRTLVIATHDPLVFDHPLVSRVLTVRDGRIEGEERR